MDHENLPHMSDHFVHSDHLGAPDQRSVVNDKNWVAASVSRSDHLGAPDQRSRVDDKNWVAASVSRSDHLGAPDQRSRVDDKNWVAASVSRSDHLGAPDQRSVVNDKNWVAASVSRSDHLGAPDQRSRVKDKNWDTVDPPSTRFRLFRWLVILGRKLAHETIRYLIVQTIQFRDRGATGPQAERVQAMSPIFRQDCGGRTCGYMLFRTSAPSCHADLSRRGACGRVICRYLPLSSRPSLAIFQVASYILPTVEIRRFRSQPPHPGPHIHPLCWSTCAHCRSNHMPEFWVRWTCVPQHHTESYHTESTLLHIAEMSLSSAYEEVKQVKLADESRIGPLAPLRFVGGPIVKGEELDKILVTVVNSRDVPVQTRGNPRTHVDAASYPCARK
ncbi:hypothetical protein B0H16DRAFT_1449874 [Mycena metata]|uniref:Uncharacterized protein n=1 Tax=Mycena metata TaxID=1033252 RepID=A0AAD7K1N0_9AGAR|nr:hypothetical protein B0H16DRAFT_1449874 [Mycena metata]